MTSKPPALKIVSVLSIILPAALFGASPGTGSPAPDFTRGDSIPEKATHDWNLGPTGARGWIYSNKLETSEARQIYITAVEPQSPSDGVLQKGDVILGVNGAPFSYDPRTELSKAITVAEGGGGPLGLLRWRGGKTETVSVPLAVLGSYSPTAPFECAKSGLILERGCKALSERMAQAPESGHRIPRSLNTLALLASGKADYLPLIRSQVESLSRYEDPQRRDLHSWTYGYVNLLVAEYILATGDRTFEPDLRRMTKAIVAGQSGVGSWGHRFTLPGDPRLQGYGMMNSPGIPLTLSLVLAREAGIDFPELDEAIAKSSRLLGFYVGKGSVPYGDHHPWIETHDDNGKNGMSAVLFNLLGDTSATGFFSRMSVASHGAERDCGHTGNFFNLLWAMPGVALAGPQASGAWMNEFGWYFDLARRWDGTFVHLGPPQERPDSYANWDATGAFLLAYAQPLSHIHLTGRKSSPETRLDAATASALIDDGRGWSPRLKHAAYARFSEDRLLEGLASWSPVVRERCALALADQGGDPVPELVRRLGGGNHFATLGACQALTALGKKGAPAVPALRKTLASTDLWTRIQAANALAAIGDAAMPAVPDLLSLLSAEKLESDPRGMQQRYLAFALFDRRDGLLKRSLNGVDREALYEAVRNGLGNEDGRARSTIGSFYTRLSGSEIEPLLPAIHRAVVEPAPSGEMFADAVRTAGLEILAKHRIAEGLPLCLEVMEPERWGKQKRIEACLKALGMYGGAAKPLLPELEQIEATLRTHTEAKSLSASIDLLVKTMEVIRTDPDPPALRPLPSRR